MNADLNQFRLLPPAASEFAQRSDLIFWVVFATCAAIVLLLIVLVVGFSVRYRAAAQVDRTAPPRSHAGLEWTWIIGFTLYGLAVFGWAARTYFDMSTPPAAARTIYVVGKQWMWKVQHASGRREINELHVPIGEPIRLVLRSEDVIHSFYLPAFRVKQDALPTRYTQEWFTPTQVGEYFIFCAEYCGSEHARMRGRVYVMPREQFAAWLAGGDAGPVPGKPGTPEAPLALRGQGAFYRLGCNACHARGATVVAPRLDGLFGREVHLHNNDTVIADENYIRESILNPDAKLVAGFPAPSLMPTYRGLVRDDEISDLIEFIKSLQQGWPEEAVP